MSAPEKSAGEKTKDHWSKSFASNSNWKMGKGQATSEKGLEPTFLFEDLALGNDGPPEKKKLSKSPFSKEKGLLRSDRPR